MNILQIQNRVQEMPNTPQTMQYLNAALNGRVTTVPPYIAAAELKRRESEGMMDQLAKGAAQGPQPTVKDQLEEKMGIMALMGQAQPPQRPQIPQPGAPEQQPQAEGGIDNLPVKEDMFGMAGGGIVAFQSGGVSPEFGGYAVEGTSVNPLYFGKSEEEKKAEAARKLLQFLKENAPETAQKTQREEPVKRDSSGGASGTWEDKPIAPATNTGKTPPRPGARPPAAAKPPVASPATSPTPAAPEMPWDSFKTDPDVPGVGDLAPGAPKETLMDTLGRDPAYAKALAVINKANPYGGRESQADYLKRIQTGVLSQIPGGKMPWETSEARLKAIEGRRQKEDEEYAAKASSPARRFEDFLTFASNVGQGSFGQGSSQGVRALQGLERSREAESNRRKALRDEQSMKLMEIRALNDQARFAYATGNMKEFERLDQEAKKLEAEYGLKQGEIAKGITEVGAAARSKQAELGAGERKLTVEDKRARDILAEESRRAKEKLDEESRQKDLERQNRLQEARIQAAARTSGRGELTPAQTAKIRKDAEAVVAARENKDTRLRMAYSKDPAARAAAVQAEEDRLLRGYTSGSPSPGTPAGGNRPPLSSFQR